MPCWRISAPVGRAAQADAHSVLRYLRKGQVIRVADLRHTAIFNAVGFQFALAEHRRIRRVFAKIDSVRTGDQTKMRHRRQVILAVVADDPGVGAIELRI